MKQLVFVDKGEVFGWGNTEYQQLADVSGDEMQINIARHLPLKRIGRVKKVAASGSMCAAIDGNLFYFVCNLRQLCYRNCWLMNGVQVFSAVQKLRISRYIFINWACLTSFTGIATHFSTNVH